MTALKTYFFCFIILIVFTTHGNTQATAFAQQFMVHEIRHSENNLRNSEGDFITLKDGGILFIYSKYYGNSSDDFAPADLVARTSGDGGKTWTTEDRIIVKNEGAMNVMSVSLLRLRNGDIALFYARKNSLDDCKPYMRTSSDEGKTWSDPVLCIPDRNGYFVLNNSRAVMLKNGRIILPVSLHKTDATKWNNRGILRTYFSDDMGRTWRSGEAVPNPDSVITQEPGIVELKNGDLMMIIRANGGFQQLSYSGNQGQTWSPVIASTIKSPISPATITRIPGTNDLLLVWNNNGEKGEGYFKAKRTPLSIAVSKDEGKTWLYTKDLETDPDGMFCYTAVHFTKDHVLLGYGLGAGLADSRILRIPLTWIYNR